MADEHQPAGHPQIPPRKIGALLVNLGTPDKADVPSVRRYLREFLSDRRVIEIPPLLWQPVLNGVILTLRPPKTAKLYQSIWMHDHDESPLRHYTRAQATETQARLDPTAQTVRVDWAMRYGTPSIKDKLAELQAAGCDRIALFALYPQYSATTTATVYDKAFDALKALRWQPAVRTIGPYHDDPDYITAVASGLKTALKGLDWTPDVILASFHGLPKKYFERGDPYHCQCAKTTRLLREAMGLGEERLRLTFQSRFGPQEWLTPYTDETLKELAAAGTKRVAVVTPGFSVDCLETLEEIAIQNREMFLEAGGEAYAAIPCLNASAEGIDVIEAVLRRELAGWVDAERSPAAAEPR